MRREENNAPIDPMEDLRAELLRLQRQFRLLEDDRNAYREETEYSLSKQRETIKVLNDEHDELAKDNKLAGSTRVKNDDAENTEKLIGLLHEEANVKVNMADQKVKLDTVNRNIGDLLTSSDAKRKKMGGCKESERKTKEMNKMRMVMENRLNEASKKFNMALAENNKMRQEIDHIKIQRKKFDDLHKKLTSMFNGKKKEKDSLIGTATALFNSRDEAHHRMQMLREKSERDIGQYNADLKDLLRVIDHDKTLHDFMATKTVERSEMYEASIQGRKEKKLQDYVKTLQGQVDSFEEIFNQLIDVSGEEDVTEMVNKFILVEDENFATFNYIKDQTQKIQEKEAAIQAFKEQISKMNVDDKVIDAERQQIHDRLLQEEKDTNIVIQKHVQRAKEGQEKIDRISKSVDTLFDTVGISRSARNNLLAGSKITNDNILQWIGLIEQRSSELIQAKALSSTKYRPEGASEPVADTANKTFNTIGKMIHFIVNPPSIHADQTGGEQPSTVGDASRPLSSKETRALVATMAKIEKDKKVQTDTTAKKSVKAE